MTESREKEEKRLEQVSFVMRSSLNTVSCEYFDKLVHNSSDKLVEPISGDNYFIDTEGIVNVDGIEPFPYSEALGTMIVNGRPFIIPIMLRKGKCAVIPMPLSKTTETGIFDASGERVKKLDYSYDGYRVMIIASSGEFFSAGVIGHVTAGVYNNVIKVYADKDYGAKDFRFAFSLAKSFGFVIMSEADINFAVDGR